MMTALAVAALVFGLVLCDQVSPISAGCGSIFLPDQHHALVGHSFLDQTGTGRIQCMMLCWRHSRCLSFNHDDTGGTCQLNYARKEEFPESYKQDDRLSYFGSSNKGHGGVFETTTPADKIATTSTTASTTTTAAATTTTAAPTTTTAPPTTTTAAPTTTTAAPTTTTAAPTTTTIAATTPYACSLGMESGAIADSQITSNYVLDDDYENYGPALARLNGAKSWCGSWIQVDLGHMDDLYAIIVQGRNGVTDRYVAHFYLSYSDDGVTWTDLKDTDGSNKYHFSNASGRQDVRVPVESGPSVGMIRCRYIRIRPSGWIGDKCMRFELIGCD